MSTLEATVSMIERCTEDELQVVQQVIRQFFLNRGTQTITKNHMGYKVILSDIAKQQLDNILFYIYITLCNETAARSVLQDAENTIQKLARSGGSLKLKNPDNHQSQ